MFKLLPCIACVAGREVKGLTNDKWQVLVTTNKPVRVNIESNITTHKERKNIVGIRFDSNLSLENQFSNRCKKANQKLHALARIVSYKDFDKQKCLMEAFKSQFKYCPLVWMFHRRKLNNRINKIHERALRLTYEDTHSSFYRKR